MNARKLLISLLSAGMFLVGFGSFVLPASADTRYVVTLVSGETVQIDVPDGQTVEQVVGGPVLSARPVAAPAPAPTPAPAPPVSSSTAPAPPATTPSDATPTDEPGTASKQQQETSPEADPKAQPEGESTAGDAAEKQGEAKADATKEPADDAGAPSPADPGFALSLPGPAPIGVPNFFIDKFRIPPFLLPIYQAAGIEYGVRWEVLAAINEIETDYGRNLNVSSAGALGWMQFIPSSWKLYGVDANRDGSKDPYNPVDAIFAAARYLKAAGADGDLRRAIFAYNHADWYVESVLMRARLIGGLPADLVGSLGGLTQGHFPVHAKARYADDLSAREATKRVTKGRNAALPVDGDAKRRGVRIFAKAGSPVVAVQDGKIVRMGWTQRLGRFVQLRDVYGNTYTYAHLKKLARAHPVPKQRTVSRADVRRELDLPRRDPAPQSPASAGKQGPRKERAAKASAARASTAVAGDATATDPAATVAKERIFAHPDRPRAFRAGGEEQLLESGTDLTGSTTFNSYFTELYGLKRKDVVLKRLKPGSKVIAGTILGRIGTDGTKTAPHTLFEIRPAGREAPRIDPKPILDGWKLLESTAIYRAAGKNPFFGPDADNPSIGQILLMSKEALQRRVLTNANIEIYECGRRDVRAGGIDRRVLAALEFLAASGLKPAVTSLHCGHGYYTASGNVSHHSSGNAVDIAKVNGIPILGHQGEGSITDITVRRLLTLQGTMRPDQIISLMTFEGADNTMALPDHADHIHVGFRPLFGTNAKLGRQLNSVLKPGQWIKLIDRLGKIDNPTVLTQPSKYSIKVTKPKRASRAHAGE
jgi:soluble lytic murein transglycosylase-like protein